MTEPQAYRDIRRGLLSRNPYFQRDLLKTRKELGIPEMGIMKAAEELGKDIPTHPMGFPIGRPDLDKLLIQAQKLGLPLDKHLEELRALYSKRGMDFDEVLKETGWGALPILTGLGWAQRWVQHELKAAGLNFDDRDPFDTRLPSVQAVLLLVREYRLGEDFVSNMSSLVFGIPRGGGDADILIQHRRDGSGLVVTLNCVRYDCTQAEWQGIFHDAIQPALLYATGKVKTGIPGRQAIEEARRRSRPGRPPYAQVTLERDMRWREFCYQNSYLTKGITDATVQEYLNNISEHEVSAFEEMDIETFRRTARRLDKMMKPTDKK